MDLGVTVLPRLGGGHVDNFARAGFDHDVSDSYPIHYKWFCKVFNEFSYRFCGSRQYRSPPPQSKKGRRQSAPL